MNLSRRTLMVGTASALALAGAGGAVLASQTEADLVHSILSKHVGPFEMDEAETEAFAAAFEAERPYIVPGYKLRLAAGISMDAGLEAPFRRLLPAADEEELVRFERELLAAFHTMTDFAWRSDAAEPVRFTGAGPCQNPFAVLA